MTATHLHRSNAARRARPPHPGRPPPPSVLLEFQPPKPVRTAANSSSKPQTSPHPPPPPSSSSPPPWTSACSSTRRSSSPPVRPANGATATELDQDEAPGRLHVNIHAAPLEIHSATFRPTDEEKRIRGEGRDAKTGAVVRGSTEGFAHVDVVDKCGGTGLYVMARDYEGAVGHRGGAGVVSAATVECGATPTCRPSWPRGRMSRWC